MTGIDFYRNLPQLETERLVLRKYTLKDVNDYFNFASDEEVTRFLRWGPHPNVEYTTEYIQAVIEGYSEGKDSPWGIELKESKKLIGVVHVMQFDIFHKKAQVGFVLAQNYWSKGYATEALSKTLEYCFTVLQLNRIEALCLPESSKAIRVLERIGMQNEGTLRKYLYQKEKFRDFIMFSLLRSEYEG